MQSININRNIGQHEQNLNRGLTILYGPSFSIHPPSFALDHLIAELLHRHGAEIIPIYCNSIQEVDCNVYGGDWGGGTAFQTNCISCSKQSELLWQPYSARLIKLGSYLSDCHIEEINNSLADKSIDDLLDIVRDNVPIGLLAKDILVNNFLVASLHLVPNAHLLLKVHVANLLKLYTSYSNILDTVKPDRVISNDSYYGMWAVMETLCKKRSIEFYSLWPVTKDRVAFAHNDAAMNLHFKIAWNQFSQVDLSETEKVKINQWLEGDRMLTLDTTKPADNMEYDGTIKSIDPYKPTIILAANVIWDLAALNKQIVFSDMIDWINQTISWFELNPHYQLVIKPHPAESAPEIPQTRQTVKQGIEQQYSELPRNVLLLKSNTHLSITDLAASFFNLKGFVVHTSTAGYEFAARGFKAITTGLAPYRGFGFTYDPTLQSEYFDLLFQLCSSIENRLSEDKILLAQKFLKFYQFHYYIKHGLFDNMQNSLMEMPCLGDNQPSKALAYVINRILQGLPILSEHSWPPES